MADEGKQGGDGFVKSAKNIVNGIILGSLLSIGALVINSNMQIAVLSEKVSTLSDSVKTLAANGYTASTAIADFHIRDNQISHNSAAIEDHEKRLRDLEISSALRKK